MAQFRFLIKMTILMAAFWLASMIPGESGADTGGSTQPSPVTGQNETAPRYVGQPDCAALRI